MNAAQLYTEYLSYMSRNNPGQVVMTFERFCYEHDLTEFTNVDRTHSDPMHY